MGALVTIGGSLREAFFMFWETLWALVLGFGLSGAVQAFVSRGQMQRVMGRRGPAALARADPRKTPARGAIHWPGGCASVPAGPTRPATRSLT